MEGTRKSQEEGTASNSTSNPPKEPKKISTNRGYCTDKATVGWPGVISVESPLIKGSEEAELVTELSSVRKYGLEGGQE